MEDRYQIDCVSPSWISESALAASIKDFDHYISILAKSIKHSTHIVAWSLGGLFAIRLAKKFPALVNKIVFVSSAARFVSQEVGIDPGWFDQFQRDYGKQPIAALKKFLALQVKGDEFSKTTLRQLRAASCIDLYNLDECRFGLTLLQELDLVVELKQLSSELAFVHGECDAVLPICAAQKSAELSNAKFYSIPAAGHAPHVSHPEEVANFIMDYFA